MSNLFLDIETTGLPVDYFGLIMDTSNWPRVLQMGMVIKNRHGGTMYEKEFLIKPDGWKVAATEIHGITQEEADRHGVGILVALAELSKWAHVCDVIICHNVDFDLPVVQAEYYRYSLPHPYNGKRIQCTQKQTTEILKIRKKQNGFNQSAYKWPSLKELAAYCKVKWEGEEHTALAEAEVCAKCYYIIKSLHPAAFSETYSYRHLKETIGETVVVKGMRKSYIRPCR